MSIVNEPEAAQANDENSHVTTAYRDPASFLRPYISGAPNKNPNLSYSLNQISQIPNNGFHIAALSQSAVCLIEGYTDPLNANELNRFLGEHGIENPELHAIDLIDVPSLYEVLGIPFPQLNFIRANAANLIDVFEAGKFDLVVQDFLLNCAPVALHGYILTELSRVMSDRGVALLSFTALQSEDVVLEAIRSGEFESLPENWDPKAYSVEDVGAVDDGALRGKRFYCSRSQSVVYVTPQTGNFEFYRSFEQYASAFQRAGLCIMEMTSSTGEDAHSQTCYRYHCIVSRDRG